MPASFQLQNHTFDLGSGRTDAKRVAFPVGPWTVCSVQLVPGYNISGAFAVKVYRSNNNVDGHDPEEGTQSLAAAGMTETLDCSGFAFLICEVTTNATSGRADIVVCCKGDA